MKYPASLPGPLLMGMLMGVLGAIAIFLLAVLLTAAGMTNKAHAAPNNEAANSPSGKAWWDDTPWDNPERGFNWYPPDAQPKPKKQAQPKPKSIKEMATMEDLRKELSRLKDMAIMQPTPNNLRVYLEAQTFLMDKSSVFADTARRVVWATPAVDYNNRSPVANFARIEQQERRLAGERDAIRARRNDYALAFFFRSDCPYCHNQAPVLKAIERQYGIKVLAITMDGKGLPDYPDARPDNGVSAVISGGNGIQMVPSLFLVDRKNQSGIPIGTGVLAQDEILTRIRVLTQTVPGQDF